MTKRMTLREVAESWLRMKREQVKESSYAAYAFQVERHLLPRFGNYIYIKEECVQAYVSQCLRQGASVTTVRDRVGVLRMMVRHAARRGWMRSEEWEIRYSGHWRQRQLPVLTAGQQRSLLDHVRRQPTPRGLGVCLSLTSGLRIGEVCGLRWGDIDTGQATITIRRTVERVYDTARRSTRVLCSTPKTPHSHRTIPMGRELQEMAARLRVADDCYLLTGTPQPLEPRTYRSWYKRMLRQLGIPATRFHALRHSFATRCIEGGCDCKTVSEILGHANVGITLNLYTHPGLAQKRRCIETLVQMLDGANP